MGGKSSSSAKSTSNIVTTTTDKRMVVDNGSMGFSTEGPLSFSTTDSRSWNAVDSRQDNRVWSATDARQDNSQDNRVWSATDARQDNSQDNRVWSATDARQDNSVTNYNDISGDVVKSALDSVNNAVGAVKASDATNGQGFDKLLDLASNLFDKGEGMVTNAQQATLEQIGAINAAASDRQGAIDQKTIIVLAVAGAAVAVAAWGNK